MYKGMYNVENSFNLENGLIFECSKNVEKILILYNSRYRENKFIK